MKLRLRVLTVLALLPLVTGCLTNAYEEHYVAQRSELEAQFVRGEPDPVRIAPVTTEDGVVSAIEAGYIPIGTSSFEGPHAPWTHAIDVAESVGADLVLIDEVHKRTGTRTSVIFLPTMTHSYTSGSVSGTAYGSYGSSTYVSGNYSGSTTSTSYSAVSVQVPVEIYDQSAMFLRKGDFEGFYGAVLYVPRLLPDEEPDAEIPVTILAVLQGSQAQKDGFKRGQRVKAVNGKHITTRATIEPFVQDPRSIRSVEVEK